MSRYQNQSIVTQVIVGVLKMKEKNNGDVNLQHEKYQGDAGDGCGDVYAGFKWLT